MQQEPTAVVNSRSVHPELLTAVGAPRSTQIIWTRCWHTGTFLTN